MLFRRTMLFQRHISSEGRCAATASQSRFSLAACRRENGVAVHRHASQSRYLLPLSRTSITSIFQIDAKREYSTAGNGEEETTPLSSLKVYILEGLIIAFTVGAAIVSKQFYDARDIRKAWPEVLQDDLLNGVRTMRKGDWETCETHFSRAWKIIRTVPTDSLSPHPFVKMFSIAVLLANAMERQDKIREAYDSLAEAVEHVRPNVNIPPVYQGESGTTFYDAIIANLPSQTSQNESLSRQERRHLVLLLWRLLEMTKEHSALQQAGVEKKWLAHAVEEILVATKVEDDHDDGPASGTSLTMNDLGLPLPRWLTGTTTAVDLMGLFRRLAQLYEDESTLSSVLDAVALHAAITTLLKSSSKSSLKLGLVGDPIEDFCGLALANAHIAGLLTVVDLTIKELTGSNDAEYMHRPLPFAIHTVNLAEGIIEIASKSKTLTSAGHCAEAFLRSAKAVKVIHEKLTPGDNSFEVEDYNRIRTALSTWRNKYGVSVADMDKLLLSLST